MTLGFNRCHRLVALIAVALASGGCGRPALEPAVVSPATLMLRIIPFNPLAGELKRLEPHFEGSFSCVRLEYAGPRVFFEFECEVWETGKAPRWDHGSKTLMDRPAEASFSVRETTDPATGRRRCRLVRVASEKSGCATLTAHVDAPAFGGDAPAELAGLPDPRELAEGEWAMVWAYVVPPAGAPPKAGPLEEAVKGARWALVVKARWERAEKE